MKNRIARMRFVREGISLRARLLSLILIPLVGGCVVLAGVVVDNTNAAQAARKAERSTLAAAALVTVQADFEQEIVPSFAAAVLRNPSVLGDAVTATIAGSAGPVIAQLGDLRSATDAAIDSLSGAGLDSGGFRAQLVRARAGIDDSAVLTDSLAGVTPLLKNLAQAQTAQIVLATRAGTDKAVQRALADVSLVARASQEAAGELTLYAGTQFPGQGELSMNRLAWTQGWTASTIAADAVVQSASAATASDWNTANDQPSVANYNSFVANETLIGTPRVPFLQFFQLFLNDRVRNHTYATVQGSTLERAVRAGRAQRAAALRTLEISVGAGVLLALLTIVISVRVGRSITRPLDRLAGQATRISEGELVDVAVSGPREVRTVAEALSNSVHSLRNIEAYAAAVAAGELDSSAVHTPLPGPLGQVVHNSMDRIITAINDREAAQRELAHRAAHDELTELPNRAQALLSIQQALHRAQRSGSKTALMFIDLDYFKAVNDTFGHAAGDEVLQVVAQRMLHVVRDGDSVARLGGDEFVVLLEAIADEADIARLADRIVEQISLDIVIDTRIIHVGASVGVSFCRDGWVDADRLLHEADAAAYRAKNAGRGRVDIFDDGLRKQLEVRADLERAMTSGLAAKEFVLYYQPVVDLKTHTTVGVEALIRWNRPGFGLVGPDDFIPIAEQSILINEIGRWVLHEATAQLARWPGDHRMTMAVNISGTHLTNRRLIADVADALTASGIDPTQLIIEITETVLVDDNPTANTNIEQLRQMGVQISIDDFGTGFTSIGRLPTLQADTLKIDKSFIASPDPAQQALVELIVSAAHAFGLTVVAEGIENQQQSDRMSHAHVEYGQGFLYAGPLPPLLDFPQIDLTSNVSTVQ